MTLDEIAKHIQRRKSFPPRAVAITFDDGYLDNYQLALPILQRLGFKAAFFIVAGQIGRYNLWDRDSQLPFQLVNWRQLHRRAPKVLQLVQIPLLTRI